MKYKVPTLILNCVAAVMSLIPLMGAYSYSGFGHGITRLTNPDNHLYSYAQSLSYVGFILAVASIGMALLAFFRLRKNKIGFYVLMQLILFALYFALNAGAVMGYTYLVSGQLLWTGTFMNSFGLTGIAVAVAGLILGVMAAVGQKKAAVKA